MKEYHIRFLLFYKTFDLVRRLLVSPPTVARVQSIIVLISAISAAEEKADLFFHTKLCRRAILLFWYVGTLHRRISCFPWIQKSRAQTQQMSLSV